MNKKKSKEYTSGFEAGKISGGNIAFDAIFHYLQDEGLGVWVTGYDKEGNLNALTYVHPFTLQKVLVQRVKSLLRGWTPKLEEIYRITANMRGCHANREGDCVWEGCPQIKDGEPLATGRSCPLEEWKDEEG